MVDAGIAYSEGNWPQVSNVANPIVPAAFGHELALVLALLRDPHEACAWGERALPLVLKGNSPALEANVRRPLTLGYVLAGDVARAGESTVRVREIARTTFFWCSWEDAGCVGFRELRLGRFEDARANLERILAIYEERRQVAAISGVCLQLAACDLEAGDHVAAEAHALRSLGICRDGGNVLFELWVLPLLVELYLSTGATVKATKCVTRGFALLTPDQNWRGLPAPMHLARGNLAAAEGRWDEAACDSRHRSPSTAATACRSTRRWRSPRGDGCSSRGALRATGNGRVNGSARPSRTSSVWAPRGKSRKIRVVLEPLRA